MKENWHPSTAVVGFHSPVDEHSATKILKNTIGFLRVKHKYRLINAVLVETKPQELQAFIISAVKLDEVEYAEKNYLFTPAAYEEHVISHYALRLPSTKSVRALHSIWPNTNGGLGAAVAIIDSGISPHPYLPATSFFECATIAKDLCASIADSNIALGLIERAGQEEQNKYQSIYNSSTDCSTKEAYGKYISEMANRIPKQLWQEWESKAQKCLGSPATTGFPSIPNIPMYRHEMGALRRISPSSRSFVGTNEFDIFDNHGHGSQMAGIIAGLAPSNYSQIDRKVRETLERFELDVIGIAPYAELVVLKCYDTVEDYSANLDALILALDYIQTIDVDVVYIGLTLDSQCTTPVPGLISSVASLARAIAALSTRDIPIVCPAGNGGMSGLHFPACIPEAIAVSDIVFSDDRKTLDVDPDSNYANKNETIACTAFGGPLITTSNNLGFTPTGKTSVAAAIVTGIIAFSIAKYFRSTWEKSYLNHWYEALQKSKSDLNIPNFQRLNIGLSKLRKELVGSCNKSLLSCKDPERVGSGIPSPFRILP
jgi:subtilisin family serine protease